MASILSSTEVASRQKCLDDLDEYISQCHSDISAMLDALEWTPDHFVQPRNRRRCPHNSDHILPSSSLPKHAPVCELVSKGCSKEEAERILEDTSFAYQGCPCVFTESIDIQKINAVLWNYHMKNNSVFYGYKEMPLTPNQEEQMLSREDRLGLADFIVNRAKEAKKLKELGRDELLVSENLADLVKREDEMRQLDPVEELAAMRDYRRRRQTYRAKNVHITKKSHTEILREVITNQMEMYAKSLSDQADDEHDSQDHSHQKDSAKRTTSSHESRDKPDRSQRDSSRRRERHYSRKRSSSRERSEGYSRHHRTEVEDRSASRERQEGVRGHHKRGSEDRSASRDRRDRSVSRYDRDQDEPSGSRERKERDRSPSRKRRSRSRDRGRRRDRSRSRSESSSRHKKHKHKKHKKHKHRGADSEERVPRDKTNNSSLDEGELSD